MGEIPLTKKAEGGAAMQALQIGVNGLAVAQALKAGW
jgi:hypothetical protein